MPTTRPRHAVTETEAVSRALADAAKRWPGERKAQLLVRLLEEGHRALLDQERGVEGDRRDAIARTSGALTGMYGPGELADLREDWPV